jgi:hypothetical protein
MSRAVEQAVVDYQDELKSYRKPKKELRSCVSFHIAPVGSAGIFLFTLTCYDEDGLKSEKAVPFPIFINLLNELEEILKSYRRRSFTGRVVGWNPPEHLRDFLYRKKVHRLFFLEEDDVLPFVRELRAMPNLGVEIVITVN